MKIILIAGAIAMAVGTPVVAQGKGKGASAKAPNSQSMKQKKSKADNRTNVRAQNKYGGNACPPGLAKKDNGCLPPGQAKKVSLGDRSGSRLGQFDRSAAKASALDPAPRGGFSIGKTLPIGAHVYNLPVQYRKAFPDSDQVNYRYGQNAIYQVDPKTKLITGIAALMTKDAFSVGAALPRGYDSYNLPMELRSQYPDTNEDLYRYANGNIYQADAKTQITKAIISAL